MGIPVNFINGYIDAIEISTINKKANKKQQKHRPLHCSIYFLLYHLCFPLKRLISVTLCVVNAVVLTGRRDKRRRQEEEACPDVCFLTDFSLGRRTGGTSIISYHSDVRAVRRSNQINRKKSSLVSGSILCQHGLTRKMGAVEKTFHAFTRFNVRRS